MNCVGVYCAVPLCVYDVHQSLRLFRLFILFRCVMFVGPSVTTECTIILTRSRVRFYAAGCMAQIAKRILTDSAHAAPVPDNACCFHTIPTGIYNGIQRFRHDSTHGMAVSTFRTAEMFSCLQTEKVKKCCTIGKQ